METKAPEPPPQEDFYDDEFSSDGSETSAPPTPRPEPPEAEYYSDSEEEEEDDDDDDDENNIQQPDEDEDRMPWRTKAWLEDAIRQSVGKVEKYNESMGLLAREMPKGEYGNYPIEWDELRGNLYREMRYQEGLRSDLNDLLARKKNG